MIHFENGQILRPFAEFLVFVGAFNLRLKTIFCHVINLILMSSPSCSCY